MIQDTVIRTERIALRRWREEDREPFARLNADPRAMEFQPSVLSREQSDRFVDYIETQFLENGFTLYATELQQQQRFIGFIGIHLPRFEAAFTPCVEIGWRLAPDVWGQGLATEGGLAVVRHSFEVLDLDELVSFTARINTKSQRVMQKIGMSRDPAEDFDHPKLPVGHPLRHHVLYRLRKSDWKRNLKI
jgi:RimJ/RimL family protein N-acetyltransferase